MGTAAVRSNSPSLGDFMSSEDRQRLAILHEIIETKSLLRGEFTLSSGRKSHYLFQLRQTTLHGKGSLLIAELIVSFMRFHGLTCIGGLVQGAVPIVAAVAPISVQRDYPVDVFFVRKEAKAHGAKERVDGYLNLSARALLVDDVTTTGTSMLDAAEAMRAAGYAIPINKALAIVDREEGAAQALAEQGIELFSFFRKSEFGL
jgi:orotate phosphoribosyltransferase